MSDTIEKLTEAVRGRVITPADSGYDDAHRAAENYGANYERLSAVKAAYDPDNLFHVNQNIAPAKRR
jgi:FAD/FMN-containing dehydrogenase